MEIYFNNPAHHQDFVRLNRAWITRYFQLEPPDLELFANPGVIADQGGYLVSLVCENQVAGVCALLKHADDEFELGKMAVDDQFKGRGLGDALMVASLEKLNSLNVKKVTLITNSQLLPAIAMYHKHGFVKTWEGTGHPEYTRGDVVMEKVLEGFSSPRSI